MRTKAQQMMQLLYILRKFDVSGLAITPIENETIRLVQELTKEVAAQLKSEDEVCDLEVVTWDDGSSLTIDYDNGDITSDTREWWDDTTSASLRQFELAQLVKVWDSEFTREIPSDRIYPIKAFKLHWLSGQEEIVSGINISDAWRIAGYSPEAISALDYYEEVNT